MKSDDLNRLSWDDFRIVKAIGDKGTLSSAAAALCLNTSTMSRRLNQVEKAMGTALFERRRTGYVATVPGTQILALASRLELDIVEVAYRVSERYQCAGPLRIATTETFALRLLTPIIAAFRDLHPAITIELLIGNAPRNLARGEADIALRSTDSPPDRLFGKRLATIGWALYAGRAGAQSATSKERYEGPWVTYGAELSQLKVSMHVERQAAEGSIACRVDSVEAAAAAIAAQIGIGYLPCLLGDAVTELVRVTATEHSFGSGLWLLTHPDIRRLERVNAFMSFCASQLTKRRRLIEGTVDHAVACEAVGGAASGAARHSVPAD